MIGDGRMGREGGGGGHALFIIPLFRSKIKGRTFAESLFFLRKTICSGKSLVNHEET